MENQPIPTPSQGDVGALVRDAQSLLRAAAAVTGEKADSLRARGLGLLDTALARMQQARGYAAARGRDMAASADAYVQDKPWRTVLAAAALGLALGLLLRRR
ncbi:YqjD family protein [Massilia sp. TS11]|uniref:DUF883 family protein n=1 Tax=Massilia sp. TS11 TaxID=2908003 RepID=UPI001EDAE089|nr:DUF883 family protein [Massilia sp. TS11]MCG2584447.1 DUF883 family protein [Massilia sp. TS11]